MTVLYRLDRHFGACVCRFVCRFPVAVRHLPVDDRLESAADKSAEPVPHEVSVARIRTLGAESKANVLH
jgi:hypothetical protein